MKNNLNKNERQDAIVQILCMRRQDTIENLAQEFHVSVRTIKYDIEELTLAYPIETVRGRYGGGVRMKEGYSTGKKYLNSEQCQLLQKILLTLVGTERTIMESILMDFAPYLHKEYAK